MKMPSNDVLCRVAAVLALVSLVLMTWSVLSAKPIAVITAMTVGQAIGTASFILYGYAVWRDLRAANVLGDTPAPR
jgi:hypothetical protein